jgi:beta-lactamase regulating signal transducer with metallopeptidase domain
MVLALGSGFGALTDRLAPALLDTAVRSLLIVGVAGLGTLAWRRGSAAARHWVWVLGFAGLLLLPVCAGVMPGWRVLPRVMGEGMNEREVVNVIVPPTIEGLKAGSVNEEAVKSEADVVVVDQGKSPETAVAENKVEGAAAVAKAEGGSAAENGPAPRPGLNVGSATPAVSGARSWGIHDMRWTEWVVGVWLSGVLVVLGHLAAGHVSLWRLRRGCERLEEGEWAEMIKGLCRAWGVGRRVELLSSPLRTMPMTWGLWRARMLVPAAAGWWPAEQRRAVLLHELAHVRRWDCLTQLLAQIVCAGYWFNPGVWAAWRRMQVERERACDDAVLNTGTRASAYARHLVESASPMESPRFVGAAALAMARRSTLEERVGAILDGRRNRRALTRWGAWVMALLVAVMVVPVAILRAKGAPTAGAAGTQMGTSVPASTATAALPDVAVEAPTCLLDATIYNVRVPVEGIGRIDMEVLTRAAATTESFEKMLSTLGASKPLYHVNQPVQLKGDTVTIRSNAPYVTRSQMARSGELINSVSYREIGANFGIAGKREGLPAGRIELDLNIGLATETAGVAMSDGVTAATWHSISMVHKGLVEVRRPFVVMSASGMAVDKEGKAIVYIARVNLDVPPIGSGAARGE